MTWIWWWQPPCLLRRVLVNTLDGKAIECVLWRSRGPWLVLRDATVLEPQHEPLKVDGELVIHRARVDFLQVP